MLAVWMKFMGGIIDFFCREIERPGARKFVNCKLCNVLLRDHSSIDDDSVSWCLMRHHNSCRELRLFDMISSVEHDIHTTTVTAYNINGGEGPCLARAIPQLVACNANGNPFLILCVEYIEGQYMHVLSNSEYSCRFCGTQYQGFPTEETTLNHLYKCAAINHNLVNSANIRDIQGSGAKN